MAAIEDREIIALYNARDEGAIIRTQERYGSFCYRIARNILSIHEDAEECVSDTYQVVWNRIPPERPLSLRAFLGRITRNLSISRYRANHAQKRYNGMEILLSELNDCVPDATGVEDIADGNRLSELISDWLESLPREDCNLFVRRYWYGESVKALAKEWKCNANQLTQKLFRMRQKLKQWLEKEGVAV